MKNTHNSIVEVNVYVAYLVATMDEQLFMYFINKLVYEDD